MTTIVIWVNERLSKIMEKLWSVNNNRLTRNVDYSLDLQNNVEKVERNREYQEEADNYEEETNEYYDNGTRPLFNFLDLKNILKRPTFRTFVALLDNYEDDTGIDEQVTDEEVREEHRFLNACLQTAVMREAHQFLVQEGKCGPDYQDFKDLLMEIWFDGYSRSSSEEHEDSSAFEHIFVGEKRGNKVLGFHNWIDYYYCERKGEISYKGYVASKTKYHQNETTDDPGYIAIKFERNGQVKNLGGFFVGFCPEFEIALYTIVFLCSGQTTQLHFANMDVTLECFKMTREGRRVIATLYPS